MASLNIVHLIVVSLLAIPLPQNAATPQSAPQSMLPDANFPNSEEGFRAQLDQISRAYCSTNLQAANAQIERFKLSGPQEWFVENFGPSEGAILAQRYERVFKDYADSWVNTLRNTCRTKATILVSGSKETTESENPFYRHSSLQPLQELPLSIFSFTIQLAGKSADPWKETFVYQNGAFRFSGLGRGTVLEMARQC